MSLLLDFNIQSKTSPKQSTVFVIQEVLQKMMQFESLDSYGHWTWTLKGGKPVQLSGFGGTFTSNVQAPKSDKGVFQCPSQQQHTKDLHLEASYTWAR